MLDTADVEELESAAPSRDLDTPQLMEGVGPSPDGALASLEEIVSALRRVREDVGQISELSSEEGKLVEAFSLALLKLMTPLAKSIPVDPSALPGELGEVERANINPKGELIVLYRDGGMEAIDLRSAENRDLLVEVAKEVIPRFTGLISERRERIERRMGFLAAVTRELQNIAEALSHAFE
ncbi:hypothetical protein AC482_05410 [miscellaneous Crenarchaeota group-15 archaeon DG-45]|uniref:Uncharacterized protein n=1 Tax=miscellaneous Crenarchaeota group-15 archaeon DG-45 TaxID=1685127 RepID=A0A0M0BND3_9ARCH|nr:MAG: hypothetical protein AC482_05410 [miscellaneous Crenarchaeota group-15 archaeon DG-45]